MEKMLLTQYGIDVKGTNHMNGRKGYVDHDSFYFIIPTQNNEAILIEQATLSFYLNENSHFHVAYPIQNVQGEWFTRFNNQFYIVTKVRQINNVTRNGHGKLLAEFHHIGTTYMFEPKQISSYGHWEKLWIDKLTAYEQKLFQEAEANPTSYYRLIIDILPYLIGISENAIQYLHESMSDVRFHAGDQGTITFHRYTSNLLQPIISFNELLYDHPTRDLAEFIRMEFLSAKDINSVLQFMNDYQELRPLSIFSWRILYARLLFPVHFYDFFFKRFREQNDLHDDAELTRLLEKQVIYEERLARFFQLFHINCEAWHIPVVEWL